MKSMTILLIVALAGLLIAGLWNSFPFVKDALHFILDPSVGKMLDWNKTVGMLVVILAITIIMTLVQKYATNQEELKKIREEQKLLQKEMEKYKDNPEKLLEFQKKQLEFVPRTMDITMASTLYTFIPIILFFRWFMDYFSVNSFKFLGFLSWFWFYLIFSIIFSTILRKVMKVY